MKSETIYESHFCQGWPGFKAVARLVARLIAVGGNLGQTENAANLSTNSEDLAT